MFVVRSRLRYSLIPPAVQDYLKIYMYIAVVD